MFRLFLICLLPVMAAAQNAGEWQRLSTLTPSDSLIVQGTEKRWKGPFHSWSAESLAIRGDGSREIRIDRPDVRRVELSSQPRRLRNVLISAAIGLGSGLTMYYTLGTRLRNESQPSASHAWMIAGPVGIGFGLGFAFPSYPVLYRAPRR